MVTDGDLTHHLDSNLSQMCVEDVMTRNPKTVDKTRLPPLLWQSLRPTASQLC